MDLSQSVVSNADQSFGYGSVRCRSSGISSKASLSGGTFSFQLSDPNVEQLVRPFAASSFSTPFDSVFFSDVIHQCVRFIRRTSSVLELIFSDCHNDQSIRQGWTFLRPNLVSNSCPRSIGSLYLQSMLNARVQRQINYQMSIGCDEREKILITRQNRGENDTLASHCSSDTEQI